MSVLYLHKHKDKLIKNVKSGYVVTCIGDNGDFSYLKTRAEDQLVDRISIHVLKHFGMKPIEGTKILPSLSTTKICCKSA